MASRRRNIEFPIGLPVRRVELFAERISLALFALIALFAVRGTSLGAIPHSPPDTPDPGPRDCHGTAGAGLCRGRSRGFSVTNPLMRSPRAFVGKRELEAETGVPKRPLKS